MKINFNLENKLQDVSGRRYMASKGDLVLSENTPLDKVIFITKGKLRLLIVTPQMHIIHHSVDRKESDMNYGFNLSIWDRVFHTYQKEFSTTGKIGQSYYREKTEHSFKKILLLPFVNVTKETKK